jgi:hypothetical protein
MKYRLALGMAMALSCSDTWADSQSDGGLEGILDRIEYRGVAPEKAVPVSMTAPESTPAPLWTRATAAVVAPFSSRPELAHIQDAKPRLAPRAGAQPPDAPASPSGVWGAVERAPSIPELDE